MDMPGPPLALLTHRIATTPVECLAPPGMNGAGHLAVAAFVNDVLLLHGQRASADALRPFEAGGGKAESNRLQLAALCAWLLADPWFIAAGIAHGDLLRALAGAPAHMAPTAAAGQFLDDPELREELARVVLARLDILPADETPAQAMDRLSAISGAERRALLDASRVAEQRARKIRAALARKAAQESADKWSRE